ncbi:hypothetical protein [Actinotalea sp. K2]|uniref:hypothetical protein n=1 Tax=Actinotalea sp. K2 TaxID=2939438 RepID=UPI002016B0E5|nr:hypothetical protein [Actinotalea sp. K2]MCL3862088.1 hypothetical protein [Actinotalea sp. K2]
MLTGYHDLLRALARHTYRLLDRHLQPGAPPATALDRDERIALALAEELRHLAGPRSLGVERGPASNHWQSAVAAVGAAGDLLATHADRAGLARSPDLRAGLSSPEARRAALGQLGDLASAALSTTDELAHRLVGAGITSSLIRERLRDPITAEILARATAQQGGPVADCRLDDLRTARPLIDTRHPLAELGDRMAHLRRYAWAASQAAHPSVDDLKVFAVLGVAIHSHAEAFARRNMPPSSLAGLGANIEPTLAPRSQSWRTVAACLQPWQTRERANPVVVGHTRRVIALLAQVAPLQVGAAGPVLLADRHVAQALCAAKEVTDAISGWNVETLPALRRSRVIIPARALTGGQVTDDRALAAAKIDGESVEVPAVVYRDLQDAYAAASGRATSRTGVLEPVFAAGLVQVCDVDVPRLESS